ncbi:MAG TPA: aldo/keto reductase [Anaerolineales bacterium]|nr:aldo/keto reductase [Anaerolineales bacterium]
MQYHSLGRSGLKVSTLALGTMQFGWSVDEPNTQRILSAAVAAGINLIDTAEIYSYWVAGNDGGVSERWIGNWLASKAVSREQVILATKARGPMPERASEGGLNRKRIFAACEASLRRLQTDYIDLYQAHWFDSETPIEETLCALNDLVRQGKVRYIGCSNYPAWRLTEAIWTAKYAHYAEYISLQPRYSLVNRAEFETDLQAVCLQYGLGVLAYSPLARGFLTGKYQPNLTPESVRANGVAEYRTEHNWSILKKLAEIANRYEKSIAQIALAWTKAQPAVSSLIIGPRDLTQLQDNLGMCALQLSAEELAALDQISKPIP